MFRFRNRLSYSFRHWQTFYISFFWVLGLLIGFIFASYSSAQSISLMRSVALSRMSISGLLLFQILPFICSAIFLHHSRSFFLYITVLLKALCFSCCSCCISIAYGDAGWLTRWLLLFSDSFSVILLLWFLLRNSADNESHLGIELLFCITTLITVGCVDFGVVAPFVETLLK